jgi:hypothetical protein
MITDLDAIQRTKFVKLAGKRSWTLDQITNAKIEIEENQLALKNYERLSYACDDHVPTADLVKKIQEANTNIGQLTGAIESLDKSLTGVELEMSGIDPTWDMPVKESDWKGLTPGPDVDHGLAILNRELHQAAQSVYTVGRKGNLPYAQELIQASVDRMRLRMNNTSLKSYIQNEEKVLEVWRRYLLVVSVRGYSK